MANVLLIIFTMSLLYLGIAHRLLTYIKIIAFQGMLLFGIAFIELIQINLANLTFVLIETIVFKAIAIPLFLNYVIKKNKIARDAEPFLSNFISLIIITLTGLIMTRGKKGLMGRGGIELIIGIIIPLIFIFFF